MQPAEEAVLRALTVHGVQFSRDLPRLCGVPSPAVQVALRGLYARGLVRTVAGKVHAWEVVPVEGIPAHTQGVGDAQPEEDPEPPPGDETQPLTEKWGGNVPDLEPGPLPVSQDGAPAVLTVRESDSVSMGEHADDLVGVLVVGPYKYTVQVNRTPSGEWVVVLLEQLGGAHVNRRSDLEHGQPVPQGGPRRGGR